MIRPEKCWNCGEKGTMKLVRDTNGQTFYQCDNCGASDNGDKPTEKK